MARIFLCHASEDKPQVQEIHDRLQVLGFDPWLDKVRLLPGQDWHYEIERALETKSIFSVVREDDSVFAHKTPPYDGKDELN